jgi:hypothetical protein
LKPAKEIKTSKAKMLLKAAQIGRQRMAANIVTQFEKKKKEPLIKVERVDKAKKAPKERAPKDDKEKVKKPRKEKISKEYVVTNAGLNRPRTQRSRKSRNQGLKVNPKPNLKRNQE